MADDPRDWDRGRHSCPLCPDRFNSVGDKKRHIRDEHKDVKK